MSNPINPVIEQAKQDGCLSLGTVDDLLSSSGINLVCTTAPVVLLLPEAPVRNVKYHLPDKKMRLRRAPFKDAFTPNHVEFEGGEHTAIGDSAILYFSGNDPGTLASQVPLALPNGLQLTYGQILALGGDFYGVVGAPISDGATPADRITRFTNAFNSLATAAAAVAEAPQILQVMQTEINDVNQALNNGTSASAAYKALADTLSDQWNQITGGGSIISPLIPPGRYLNLAAENWDHFGQHAVLAYQAGHAVALQQALTAKAAPAAQQRPALMLAYAMNAFADHYMSDLFSSGHMRTPRKELNDNVLGGSVVTGLLSRQQHDEDCLWGLNVSSSAGANWHPYGDKRYFDTVDLVNKILVDVAVQQSVDEVFFAFLNGVVPQPQDYAALLRIANLTTVQNSALAQGLGNNSPLFVSGGGTVLRRNDYNNLNDYSWTSNWWGWSTLSAFQRNYAPPPPAGYPSPPAAAPTVSPNGWQSAQSVPPNWVAGAQVRYAVSFVLPNFESNIGPWGAFTTVQANQAFPTVASIPTGLAGTVARRVWRQFIGTPCTYVGQISDNITTTLVDNNH